MSIKHAIYDVAAFKALPTDGVEEGEFEAIVSVFGNVDFQGDRVVKGAFQKSLERWRAQGAPIPVIWNHTWGDPNAHIGFADPNQVEEVEQGLKVKGKIDIDQSFAAQVYRLLKQRRVKEFSWGYNVVKERKAKDGANELLEVDIIELGPTLKGVNPSTELLSVKADLETAAQKVEESDLSTDEIVEVDQKAGRRHSRATQQRLEALREYMITEIDSLLAPAGNEEGLASLGDADDATDDDEAEAEGKATVDPQIAALKAQLNMIGG